jgi:hypothetical protein
MDINMAWVISSLLESVSSWGFPGLRDGKGALKILVKRFVLW